MENPDAIEEPTENIEQMSKEEWLYTSQPNFTNNYEVYK